MTAQDKEITDKVLLTATLASFAVPEAGVYVAAAIGTANLLFDIFCPASPSDPDLDTVDVATLKAELGKVAKQADDNYWKSHISELQSLILAHNDLFMKFWNEMGDVHLTTIDLWESAPGANDGETYIADEPDITLVKDLNTYFNTGDPNGVWLVMDQAKKVLENPDSTDASVIAHRKTESVRLYCLVASTWISYLKAIVIWDWAHNHVLKWDKYVVYLSNNKLYQGGSAAYRAKHDQPQSPLDTANGEIDMKKPDWNTWSGYDPDPKKRIGGPVKDMIDTINKILSYVEGDTITPGLYTTMYNNWYVDRYEKVRDRVGELSIQTDGSKFWYNDSDAKAGGSSPHVAKRELAEIHMEGKRGALIAYWWDYWTQAYALDNVDEEAIRLFGEAIRQWKAARASVNFAVHVVTTTPAGATETLADVAKGFYKSDDYRIAIFDANRAALQIDDIVPGGPELEIDRVDLTLGQRLKLPDKAEINYTIQQVQPGGHLKAIGASFYGSELYDTAIFDANVGNLKVIPWAAGLPGPEVERVWLFAGQLIKLPAKADIGYTFYTTTQADTQNNIKGKGSEALKKIAVECYGHELYDLAVYKANWYRFALNARAKTGLQIDKVFMTAGQILRLWPRDDVGFVLYRITDDDAGNYPDRIIDRYYTYGAMLDKTAVTNAIANANADILSTGQTPAAGTVIRVPVPGTNRDTNLTTDT